MEQISLDSPETGITTYEFDTAGNRTAATDARSIRTEYYYDALNRLTDISYPDSSLDVSFTYDAGSNGIGRLSSMSDAVGPVDYSYDTRGNLLSENRIINGSPYLTQYTYNAANRLIQTTYPSGMVIATSLDAVGRPIGISKTVDTVTEVLLSNAQYQPFGPVSSFSYGNGLSYTATFDQDYQLNQLQSGPELDWSLGYDPVGNILAISDQADSQNSQLFSYDDLYRLDSGQGSYGDEAFEYDANGNRTRYLSGLLDEPYSYAPQSSRLIAQNGWSFDRDAVGNRTTKLDSLGYGQLFNYADNNRLAQTATRDGSGDTIVMDYQYDGRGQRVSKQNTSTETHYIYGPSGQLLGEYGGTFKEYIYFNGQLLASYQSGTATDLTIDNTQATASGNWQSSTSVPGFIGSDYQSPCSRQQPIRRHCSR